MAVNATVLSIGSLTVRSSKAAERLKQADFSAESEAHYTFTGLSDERVLKLFGQQPESGNVSIINNDEEIYSLKVKSGAIFFDQTPYTFSLNLPDAVEARIFSPLASWCDNADWDDDSKKLNLPVNFGNDLGDFELCWEWLDDNGDWHSASIKAQVFSTKLDIQNHFFTMIHDVEERFSWLRLDFLKQTAWGWSRSDNSESNQKSWLLIFQNVRQKMAEGFNELIDHHRKRLVSNERSLRAEQLKKITPRNEERIAEGIIDRPDKRYRTEYKSLDADTPENRYMKHILVHTHSALNELISTLQPVQRISSVFKDRLNEWSEEWSKLRQHHFWKGIGRYNGLKKESLILSQDPIYAKIRRYWYWLHQGLEFLDAELHGGIQNAAQLYEIWCFIKLDEIIQNCGWECLSDKIPELRIDDDDWENEEPRSGAFKFNYTFQNKAGIDLELLFQPTAGNNPAKNSLWNGMMSVPVVQRPDIVLRLHRNDLPNSPAYTWIFDAKYRIDGNNAPDDAINQMHRYRDAILWQDELHNGKNSLIRESIGAFVLYPGDEKDSEKFPQIESVKKTNIGAYPLRPTPSTSVLPNQLSSKINELITVSNLESQKSENMENFDSVMEKQAGYFTSVPSVKRAVKGIIGIGIVRNREMGNQEYWNTCRLYRLPEDKTIHTDTPVDQWEFLAPQSTTGTNFGVFPIIKKPEKLKRSEIVTKYFENNTKISSKPQDDDKLYWLFTLGEPLPAPDDLDKLKRGKIVRSVRI